jgi:hypothetical protein
MLRCMRTRSALCGLLFLIVVCFISPAAAAASQQNQIAAIQALLRDFKFSDVVEELSELPQVQQHAQELEQQELGQQSAPRVAPHHALVKQCAVQFLHQMCLDGAEHLPPRLVHACFHYIVERDQERTARWDDA